MGVYRPKKSRYYWIDFYYKGRRYRESSESPRKRDAELLLGKIAAVDLSRTASRYVAGALRIDVAAAGLDPW